MQTITQIKTLTSQLRPEEEGKEATRATLNEKKRELWQQRTRKEAFERLVEHTRERRLALRREVADLYDVVGVLQRWKDACEDALDEVLSFEREAAQEVIDEIERAFYGGVALKGIERDVAIRRAHEAFESGVRMLEDNKRAQIAETLDLIDVEPCCNVFKAVVAPDEQDLLTVQQNVKVLKEWAGKETAELVYDSATCDFSHDAFNACFRSPSNAVVGITEDGDVFGGFVSVVVRQVNNFTTDPVHFILSLASHRRCAVPQRWAINPEKQATAVRLFDTTSASFVRFGGGSNEGRLVLRGKERSFCCNLSESYVGLEDLWLSGKNGNNNSGLVHLRRLFVIRLN